MTRRTVRDKCEALNPKSGRNCKTPSLKNLVVNPIKRHISDPIIRYNYDVSALSKIV